MQPTESQMEPGPSGPSGPEITPVAPKRKLPKMYIVLIIVAVIVIAGLGAFAFIYLGSGSLLVTSNSQVGAPPAPANPNPLGTTSSLGALVFNKTLSSSGAPFISTGGHIVFVAAVAQPPTFGYDNLVDPVSNRWTNYTWNVIKITLAFG